MEIKISNDFIQEINKKNRKDEYISGKKQKNYFKGIFLVIALTILGIFGIYYSPFQLKKMNLLRKTQIELPSNLQSSVSGVYSTSFRGRINFLNNIYHYAVERLFVNGTIHRLNDTFPAGNHRIQIVFKNNFIFTSLSNMFYNTNTKELNLNNLNTSNVVDMSNMFKEAGLEKLEASRINTQKLRNMNSMFESCRVTSLDLSNFKVSSVVTMSKIFKNAYNLKYLNLTNWDVSKVTNMNEMFAHSFVKKIDIKNFNTSSAVDMSGMFDTSSSEIDITKFNTKKVTNMANMFSNLIWINNLNISNFDTSSAVNMSRMFFHSHSRILDVSHFKTDRVINMSNMFGNNTFLISLNLSNFNTRNVVDMSYMFSGCSRITSLDLSKFDTGNVQKMSGMFSNTIFTSLDLSKFNTGNVVDMSEMFKDAKKLVNIKQNFYAPKLRKINSMFYNCNSLTSLNLINLRANFVEGFQKFLYMCVNLTYVDLTNIHTTSELGGLNFEAVKPDIFCNDKFINDSLIRYYEKMCEKHYDS